jgi:hypothetical protein
MFQVAEKDPDRIDNRMFTIHEEKGERGLQKMLHMLDYWQLTMTRTAAATATATMMARSYIQKACLASLPLFINDNKNKWNSVLDGSKRNIMLDNSKVIGVINGRNLCWMQMMQMWMMMLIGKCR